MTLVENLYILPNRYAPIGGVFPLAKKLRSLFLYPGYSQGGLVFKHLAQPMDATLVRFYLQAEKPNVLFIYRSEVREKGQVLQRLVC